MTPGPPTFFWRRMMNHTARNIKPTATQRRAFTLIEILVVMAIIALLTSILTPSLISIKRSVRGTVCLSNLRNLGTVMNNYHATNDYSFWPYRLDDRPTPGTKCYWWGTDHEPVEPADSPFMEEAGGMLNILWCPSMPWGSYTPQGWYVGEPTTTYGYNAYYLDPSLRGIRTKKLTAVRNPAGLFVFNDSAMFWSIMGREILQNSTYLEPVTGNWVQQPTSHFRHNGKTNALTADGHASPYDTEGWELDPKNNLGFVGTQNYPHYAQ